MMGLQNLCTLFGPTLMKLSPKDNLHADDMNKEIRESMQQAQALFYILQLHAEQRLATDADTAYDKAENDTGSVGGLSTATADLAALDTDLSQLTVNSKSGKPLSSAAGGGSSSALVDGNNNSVAKDGDAYSRRPHMQTAL
jgi:hypothetical protein